MEFAPVVPRYVPRFDLDCQCRPLYDTDMKANDPPMKRPPNIATWRPLYYVMVGAKGFEPSTLWSQTRCATRLRYAPTQVL